RRDRRRPRLDDWRAARRDADRGLGGAGRFLPGAVDEEHVLVRAARPGAGSAAAGDHGHAPGAQIMTPLWRSLPLRGRIVLAVFLAPSIAAPALADRYTISVLILIFYFAYVGQAWNLLMGFAGQLSLGHALYVGLGAYVSALLWLKFGIGPWLGMFAAMAFAM